MCFWKCRIHTEHQTLTNGKWLWRTITHLWYPTPVLCHWQRTSAQAHQWQLYLPRTQRVKQSHIQSQQVTQATHSQSTPAQVQSQQRRHWTMRPQPVTVWQSQPQTHLATQPRPHRQWTSRTSARVPAYTKTYWTSRTYTPATTVAR